MTILNQRQKILLTGGTSGIGLELLRQLSSLGHNLIVLGRNAGKLTQLQQEFSRLETYICDLAQREDVLSVAQKICAEHPDITLLINNAAIQHQDLLFTGKPDYEAIAREVEINFLAPVYLSAVLLDHFLALKAACAIVNICSGLAFYPKTSAPIYCATKAALRSISQSLRDQLSAHPVQVIEVILPIVDTPMTAGRGRKKLSAQVAAQQILAGVAQGKDEIYIGKARWLPWLLRISPGLVRTILRAG